MIWRTSGIVALQQESVFQLGGITRCGSIARALRSSMGNGIFQSRSR